MLIAICDSVTNKPGPKDWKSFERLTYHFKNFDTTPAELAVCVNRGWAITTQHTGGGACQYFPQDVESRGKHRCEHGHEGLHRRQENFTAGQHIGLDFDNADSIEGVLNQGFIKQYWGMWYTTPSHTPEHPRFRVLFFLDTPITDPELYRDCVQALMWKFDLGMDKACKDPCRLFYGSKDSNPKFVDRVLPVQVLEKIVAEWKTEMAYLEVDNSALQEAEGQRPTNVTRLARVTEQDIDNAARAANGFLKACRLLYWTNYDSWQRYAALALGLDRAFPGSNGLFYRVFTEASRQHPNYDHNYDEIKLAKHFPKLQGKAQNFEGLGLIYDQASKRVIAPIYKPAVASATNNISNRATIGGATAVKDEASYTHTANGHRPQAAVEDTIPLETPKQPGSNGGELPEPQEEDDPYMSYKVHKAKLMHAAELSKLPPIEWLYRNELPKRSLVVNFGPSGSGKSFVSLNYALELAQTAPVIYVTAEGTSGYDQRTKAWCRYHELDEGLLYFYTDAVNLMSLPDTTAFISLIKVLQPVLVVVDTLAWCMASFGGDENSTKDMMTFMGNCNAIRRELGATVLIIHHTGKAGSTERGSSSLKGGADTMIEITAEEDLIKIDCIKQKDAEAFEPYYLKRAKFDSSCVVVPAQPQDTINQDSGKPNAKLLDLLEILNLDTFAQAGAKSQQLVSALNIGQSRSGVVTLYRNLSALKKRGYVSQGTKGDPFFILEEGRNALRAWRPQAAY